jgi:hypothetical protein
MKKRIPLTLFIAFSFITIFLGGCKSEEKEVKKLKDLDFTVVEDADLPEELKTLIEEKKQEAFKMTYSDKENLYIVVGYGEKQTGGFSITVDELYLTDNAIYINTNLTGPSKEDKVTQALTYPYVVVKTEFIDKSVVFE